MRQRTAKTLGTRHDLSYFKYFTPFRFWRVALGLAVPVLALLWLGISADSFTGRDHTAGRSQTRKTLRRVGVLLEVAVRHP